MIALTFLASATRTATRTAAQIARAARAPMAVHGAWPRNLAMSGCPAGGRQNSRARFRARPAMIISMPHPIFDTTDAADFDVVTAAPGPGGSLPITPADLLQKPSGDLFGWTQDVGMGWRPDELGRPKS